MKELLKNFITYGLGNALQSALAFLLLPLYLRFFSPNEYGIIATLMVVLSLLTLLISGGAMNGLIRLYFERDGEQRKELVGNAYVWYLLVGAVGGAILYLAASPLSAMLFRSGVHAQSLKLLSLLFFFSVILTVPMYILRIEKKAVQFVSLSLFSFLLEFGLKFYFIVILKRGVIGYFESGVIAKAASVVLGGLFVSRFTKLSFDTPILMQLLRLGAPFILSGLAMWTLDVSDRLLLARYAGEEAVGIYSIANNFANIFTILLATPIAWLVDPYFFSRTSKQTDEQNKQLLNRLLMIYVVVGGGLYLAIALGTGELLRILTIWFSTNERYLDAVKIVPIVALAPFAYFLTSQAAYTGLLVKKPEIMSAACTAAAIGNFVLNLFIIPRFGAVGAAITTVAAYVLLLILCYSWMERVYPVRYDWLGIARIGLFLVVSFSAGWAVSFTMPVLSLLAKLLISMGLFFALAVYASGVMSKEERLLLFERAFKKAL